METKYDAPGGASGLSTGHLLFVFLVGVAVCAVFFSLGFLVGYNERSLKEVLVGEPVGPPPAVPPIVSTPPGGTPNAPPETLLPPPGTPAGASMVPGPGAGPGGAPLTPEAAKLATTAAPAGATAAPTAPPPTPAPPVAELRKPVATGTTAPGPAVPGGELGVGITLQVAASRSREDADRMVEILKGRGYPVFVVTPEYANAADNLYRVQVGPFRSMDEAQKVRAKLVEEGLKPFIRH